MVQTTAFSAVFGSAAAQEEESHHAWKKDFLHTCIPWIVEVLTGHDACRTVQNPYPYAYGVTRSSLPRNQALIGIHSVLHIGDV